MDETPNQPPKRTPIEARPRPGIDREALREDIRRRFSRTFEYLAK